MEIVVVSAVALVASLLTFFSGFGLGTILLPAFALFFPVEVAIAMTGVVHLLNNLFKMAIVGKEAVWSVVLKFGIPAIIGAILGALILMYFSTSTELAVYTLGSITCTITPIKVMISLVKFGFAVLELMPFFKKLEFAESKLYVGGAISGFFGGLSGHQGALRSAFLIKCGLSKESFIATGVIIACVVDISRISIYFTKYSNIGENMQILVAAIIAAFAGAFLGKKVLKKITIELVQVVVSAMIMVLAVLMGVGII